MAKVSISEGARMAGISRSYIYRKYITPGLLSTEKDNAGNTVVDTAEIIRVFGQIKQDSEQDSKSSQMDTLEKDSKIATLEAELRLMRELAKAKDDHIADLQQSLRLLEHRPAPEPPAADTAKLEKEVNVLKKEFRFLGLRLFGGEKS